MKQIKFWDPAAKKMRGPFNFEETTALRSMTPRLGSGLMDKNNNEMFEGDIVTSQKFLPNVAIGNGMSIQPIASLREEGVEIPGVWQEVYYEVIFKSGAFRFKDEFQECITMLDFINEYNTCQEFEITGNIYEKKQ